MFKSIKGKIIFYTIFSVITINIIFTFFIAIFLNKTLQTDIVNEMDNFKNTSLSIVKKNEIIEEPIWRTLETIKEITNAYVSIGDENNNITKFTGSDISKKEIADILRESNKRDSRIKFRKLKESYCITYNYPIYINNNFYGNLVIQKDYTDKYSAQIRLMGMIIIGQVIVVISLIAVISFVINKTINPLKELNKSMELFSRGDIAEDVIIKSKDEVEELAKTYNIMKNKIKNQMNIIIEEKEKVESLQKISREFFNNATHELKTPITSIYLYAQILRDEDIKAMDEEFIKRATDRMGLECEKMNLLVEKILDVSRGRLQRNKSKSEFSLNELIEEIIEDFEIRITSKGLYINKNLDSIKYYGVLDDIELVVSNLLDNSIKYCVGSEIEVDLKHDESWKVLFKIKNSCESIPEDIKNNLLQPFIKYNIYEDVSKETSSSGLGLYLCSELIKENGGYLTYEMKNNEICFYVLI